MRINELLKPDRKKTKFKAEAILLNSPWEIKKDPAVKHQSASNYLHEIGYRVLNKRRMTFSLDENLSCKAIGWHRQPAITVWVENHGIPGFVFGNSLNLKEECRAIYDFAQYIQKVQHELVVTVSSIILGACNSATEYQSPDCNHGFFSPARLLSILLPDIEVLGFIGRNTNVKLTNLYVQEEDSYTPVFLPLVSGSVLYKRGLIVENISDKRTLLCPTNELSREFISNCALNKDEYFTVRLQNEVFRNIKSVASKQKRCIEELLDSASLADPIAPEQPRKPQKSPRYDPPRFFSSESAKEGASLSLDCYTEDLAALSESIPPTRLLKPPVRYGFYSPTFYNIADATKGASSPINFYNDVTAALGDPPPFKRTIKKQTKLFSSLGAREEELTPINLFHEFESISVKEVEKEPFLNIALKENGGSLASLSSCIEFDEPEGGSGVSLNIG